MHNLPTFISRLILCNVISVGYINNILYETYFRDLRMFDKIIIGVEHVFSNKSLIYRRKKLLKGNSKTFLSTKWMAGLTNAIQMKTIFIRIRGNKCSVESTQIHYIHQPL